MARTVVTASKRGLVGASNPSFGNGLANGLNPSVGVRANGTLEIADGCRDQEEAMADNKSKVAQDRRSVDVHFFEPLWPIAFFQKITDRALSKSAASWHEHTAHPRPARKKRAHSRRPARKKSRHKRAA